MFKNKQTTVRVFEYECLTACELPDGSGGTQRFTPTKSTRGAGGQREDFGRLITHNRPLAPELTAKRTPRGRSLQKFRLSRSYMAADPPPATGLPEELLGEVKRGK